MYVCAYFRWPSFLLLLGPSLVGHFLLLWGKASTIMIMLAFDCSIEFRIPIAADVILIQRRLSFFCIWSIISLLVIGVSRYTCTISDDTIFRFLWFVLTHGIMVNLYLLLLTS